jgi:hypothetical protein
MSSPGKLSHRPKWKRPSLSNGWAEFGSLIRILNLPQDDIARSVHRALKPENEVQGTSLVGCSQFVQASQVPRAWQLFPSALD